MNSKISRALGLSMTVEPPLSRLEGSRDLVSGEQTTAHACRRSRGLFSTLRTSLAAASGHQWPHGHWRDLKDRVPTRVSFPPTPSDVGDDTFVCRAAYATHATSSPNQLVLLDLRENTMTESRAGMAVAVAQRRRGPGLFGPAREA